MMRPVFEDVLTGGGGGILIYNKKQYKDNGTDNSNRSSEWVLVVRRVHT
jgi:hypothetical protein